MHNWMRAEPIEVTVRRLAKYGYESIEISGSHTSITPRMSAKPSRKTASSAGAR
jgi:hypothetical protein